MKDFFVPSGELSLCGDYETLLKTIRHIDGELYKADKFRCVMHYPEWNRIIRKQSIRISFVIRCRCVEADGGYRILYRALPGVCTILLYVICLLMLLGGLAILSSDLQPSGFGVLAVSIFLFLYSLYARKKCIRRFLALFSGKT